VIVIAFLQAKKYPHSGGYLDWYLLTGDFYGKSPERVVNAKLSFWK
jgi:hypothetical protein